MNAQESSRTRRIASAAALAAPLHRLLLLPRPLALLPCLRLLPLLHLLPLFPLLLVLTSLAVLTAGAAPATTTDEAWALNLRGQNEKAARLAQDALAANASDARAAYVLIATLKDRGRLEEAGNFFRRFEAEHPATGTAPLTLGLLALTEKNHTQAESLLTLGLQRFMDRGDRDGEIVALVRLASLRAAQERPGEQEALLTAALEIANELERPMEIAALHLRLGIALLSTRRQAESAEHLERLLQAAQSMDLPIWEGDAHLHLSILARWQMDLDRCMYHRKAALEAYQEARCTLGQVRSLNYIAVIHLLQGELTRGMRLLHEALAMARERGHQDLAAGCLGDLAALNSWLGNEETAMRQLEEAIRAGDQRPKKWIALMQGNIGTMLTDQHRFSEALVHFDRALETLRGTDERRYEAHVLENVGRCLCAMGDTERGIARLEEAAALAHEWDAAQAQAQTLCALGNCNLERGDLAAAAEAFAKAARLAEVGGYFKTQASVLLGRARLARARGETETALRLLERAMEIVEGVRSRSRGAERVQVGYFSGQGHIYEEAVDLSWEMSRRQPPPGSARPTPRTGETIWGAQEELARKAFEFSQRAKARSLIDLLTEAQVDLRFRADPRYQEREQEILARIGELVKGTGDDAPAPESGLPPEVEIARLEDELALLEEELRRSDPRYAELQYPRPLGSEQVQTDLLEQGELLLEYFLGDSASYVWAITPQQFRFIRLPARGEIERQVRHLLPLLRDYNVLAGSPAYFMDPAARLSRALIGPVAAQCKRAQRVLVAPHGILHYLPFEVLLTEEPADQPPGRASFAALPYLVTATDLVYVHSVSTLTHLRSSHTAPGDRDAADLLLAGDPVLPSADRRSVYAHAITGGSPGRLPFAREEMAAIRTLFPAEQVRFLAGPDATLANLKAAGEQGSYKLVHIAAHGLFNERQPRFSGLLLSPNPATGDDGFLTAGELFGLELASEQVVLSACSSALGERVTGEGLTGLTRALLYAGARSVVAALWEVSGEATAGFMTSFYKEIQRQGGSSRAHALAEAKRCMIRGDAKVDMTLAVSRRAATPSESETAAEAQICTAHPYFWAAFVLTGDGR